MKNHLKCEVRSDMEKCIINGDDSHMMKCSVSVLSRVSAHLIMLLF